MDIAHTRRVLEAIREAGVDDRDVYERAESFLRLLQRHPKTKRPQPNVNGDKPISARSLFDGGFYFSPIVLDANKGLAAKPGNGKPGHYRSYATPTCDGVLALLACKVSKNDERVRAARRWLERHPKLDYPQGVSKEQPIPWGDTIHFYHLAVRAELYEKLDWPGVWRHRMIELIAGRQRPNGSFMNEHHLMKENDPLLCTALAVIAMSRAIQQKSEDR
jgi:hypothetical protein